MGDKEGKMNNIYFYISTIGLGMMIGALVTTLKLPILIIFAIGLGLFGAGIRGEFYSKLKEQFK